MPDSARMIDHIVVETGGGPAWSVIWLHGLGADGHDFEPVARELGFRDSPAVRFLFPHAPIRPITINGGLRMRGWYDIRGMAFDRREDRDGLEESGGHVHQLIARENARGIPAERIFLAGFSQGGAVALFAGLRYPERLAGLIALSTYLPAAESTLAERSEANALVPVFMAHGTDDPVIPLALAEHSLGLLGQMGYPVEWHTYPMPHSVHPEEILHLRTFLQGVVLAG